MSIVGKTKTDMFNKVVRPITWYMGSSIASRIEIVSRRIDDCEIARPFLTKEQQEIADVWLKDARIKLNNLLD